MSDGAPRTEMQVGAEDREAITATALDYYEGWFDARADRIERALHPDLVKRSLAEDGESISTLSAGQMVDWAAAGEGRDEDPGDRQIEVRVVFPSRVHVTLLSPVQHCISGSV